MSGDLHDVEHEPSYFAKFEAGHLHSLISEGALEGVTPMVEEPHEKNSVLHQQLVMEKPVRVL